MPHDQHDNLAEEPSSMSLPPRSKDPAADGPAFMPGVIRALTARFRIQTQVTRIGRRPDNDIIVYDLGVSKQHAELRRAPTGRCSITDLGSHGGTFVNGTRVSQKELNEGDVIAIGRATFRLAGGKLIEHGDRGTQGELPAGIIVTRLERWLELEKTALQREQDLAAELRRQLEARQHRIDSLQAELRALAAGNPAVLPVLDRLGIRSEPDD